MTVARAALACALLLLSGFEWEGRAARLSRRLAEGDDGTRAAAVRELARLPGRDVEQVLITALADDTLEVRLEAADACRVRRLIGCAPTLRSWVEDPDPDVRAEGLRALGATGTEEDVASLSRALGDARPGVRRAAADGLAALDAVGVSAALVRCLADADPLVRITAARALGAPAGSRGTGDGADRSTALSALLGLTRDEAPEVRVASLDALGGFDDARSGSVALLALGDEVEDVRLAAIALLTRVPSVQATAALVELSADETRIGRAAVAALAHDPSDPALDALLEALGRPSVARIAGEGLGWRASSSEAARLRVIDRLSVRFERARGIAELDALARAALAVAERGSIAELSGALSRALLREAEPGLFSAFGATGSEEALVPLLSALEGGAPPVQLLALDGLERWADVRAPDGRILDPLASALSLLPVDARARGVRLVARVEGPRADALLLGALSSDVHAVRIAALVSLRDRERPVGEDVLLGLFDDRDAEIRAHAALALARVGGAGAAALLSARVRSDAPFDRFAGLAALGPVARRLRLTAGESALLEDVRETFLLAFAAQDPGLADAAAIAIGASEDVALVPALVARVERAGPTERARLARALGPLDDPAARAALWRLATGDDVVTATVALAQVGETGGVEEANRLLSASFRFPRSAAASFALARLASRGALGESALALCALAREHDPHVRANVAVALAGLDVATCADGPRPLDWLDADAPALVRIAAARWAGAVAAVRESTRARAALASCAADLTQPTVARACASPRVERGLEDADVVAYDLAGERLGSRLVALRFDDGSVLVTYADSLGRVRLARAPRGPLLLDLPESAPLVP